MNDFVDNTTQLNFSISTWNQMFYSFETDYEISDLEDGYILGVTNSELENIDIRGIETLENNLNNQFENINDYKKIFEFKNYSDILTEDVYKNTKNTFNYKNVYLSEISKNDTDSPVILNKGCPLFISVSNKDFYNSYNCNFEWKLYLDKRETDGNNDKLLIISDKSFLVWHFDNSGQYSLSLKINSNEGIEFNNFYNKKIIVV